MAHTHTAPQVCVCALDMHGATASSSSSEEGKETGRKTKVGREGGRGEGCVLQVGTGEREWTWKVGTRMEQGTTVLTSVVTQVVRLIDQLPADAWCMPSLPRRSCTPMQL